MPPNFFILGAPRCGTTALATYLREHAGVFITSPKEPFHFDIDLPKPASTDRKAYLALFAGADPARHRAVGEASTSYLLSREAVPGIVRFNPDARFIVMLREPAELVRSWHARMVWSGQESLLEFEAAWRAEPSRRDGGAVPPSCSSRTNLYYSEWGRLGTQVERVLSWAPRERVLFLLLEDLAGQPAAAYRRVLDFLEVPPDGRVHFPRVNENRKVLRPRLQRLLRLGSNLATGARSRRRLRGPRRILAGLARWNSEPAARPPLSPGMHAELRDHYRDEVARLSRHIGRDLSHWLSASR